MERLKYGIHEFFYTLLAFPRAWRFMVNQKLWEGLREYGWVVRMLVITAVLLSLFIVNETVDWFSSHTEEPLTAMMIGGDSLIVRLGKYIYETSSSGMVNWVVLILLEVIIYHFMRRTLAIILKKDVANAHTIMPFLGAQIRMVKVSTMAFFAQSIILGMINTLNPLSFLDGSFSFLVETFLLGFVIADNYNEQFGLGIRQSFRHLWRGYIGICLGLGVPLYLMMLVPVLGTVIGPLVTSVTAAIVLWEKSDLHIVGYQLSKKEMRRQEKKNRRKK